MINEVQLAIRECRTPPAAPVLAQSGNGSPHNPPRHGIVLALTRAKRRTRVRRDVVVVLVER
ncbi:hypothetical protein EDD27_7171 [Nonomuraea polychroma]|uniref:Uncharacterized protein n=1 Tax=Nonomuraea polychroma TaxID=46176 RepID=A0A438MFR3_9ACTN|nr:hypothetical protein EDD27_7171 [Nonomuraea polychroma]